MLRRVVIILEYTVLGKPDNTIGDPQPYKGGQSDDKANNNAAKSAGSQLRYKFLSCYWYLFSSRNRNISNNNNCAFNCSPSIGGNEDETKSSNGPSSGYGGQQQQPPSYGNSHPQPANQQQPQQGGSFYGGQQAQARSTLASASHNVPPSHDSGTPSKVVSIASLNPYQNRFVLHC